MTGGGATGGDRDYARPLAIVAVQVMRLRDAACGILDVLRATDAVHAATYIDAACENLAIAVAGLDAQAAQEADAPPRRLRAAGGQMMMDGRMLMPGSHAVEPQTDWMTTPDLGWDLVESDAARDYATDDLAAAILQRALFERAWTRRRSILSWRTTAGAAGTIVRMLRGGRPAPQLVPSPLHYAVDTEPLALAASLG